MLPSENQSCGMFVTALKFDLRACKKLWIWGPLDRVKSSRWSISSLFVISMKRVRSCLVPGSRQFWTYRRGAFYSALEIHNSLYLATAYWQFCTVCILSLTKLLRIRLKLPFSYIYRTIIYVHAIYHCQLLNFSKLFCLEDGKKCQRPGKLFWGSPILPGMSGFLHFSFQFSCSTKCSWQSPFCFLKWGIFL